MTRRKTAVASTATSTAKALPANDTPSNGRVVGATSLPEPGFEDEDEIPDVEDAFPDEAASEEPVPPSATQHDELAPAHVHLSNTERLARQHAVFGAYPGVTATATTTAPARPARAPAYRRITAELVKAETKLVTLERRRQDSADHHERTWRQKRLALIRSFPADVLAALHAMGVLDGTEIEDSGESGG